MKRKKKDISLCQRVWDLDYAYEWIAMLWKTHFVGRSGRDSSLELYDECLSSRHAGRFFVMILLKRYLLLWYAGKKGLHQPIVLAFRLSLHLLGICLDFHGPPQNRVSCSCMYALCLCICWCMECNDWSMHVWVLMDVWNLVRLEFPFLKRYKQKSYWDVFGGVRPLWGANTFIFWFFKFTLTRLQYCGKISGGCNGMHDMLQERTRHN